MESPGRITFADFVYSLSATAIACLQVFPEYSGGKVDPLFIQAQEIINILSCLKEKTKGNLSREEGALLQDLLFDLKIWYEEKKKEAGEGVVPAGKEFVLGNPQEVSQWK